MHRPHRAGIFLTAALVAATGPFVAPAGASISQPEVVSETPSKTPHAINGSGVANAAVHTFAQVGQVMYAGGHFHSVQNPARTVTLPRTNLFSFNVGTGRPTDWAPQVNGPVLSTLYVDPYLYVGGSFTAADGVSRRLVRYRVDSGQPVIDASWLARGVNGRVSDLDYADGRLIVSGAFRKRIMALSPTTGRNTRYLALPISGSVKNNGAGPVDVHRFAISPDGRRLVGIGNFTTVGEAHRPRAFMLELGATTARVAPWYYEPLANNCSGHRAQLRDVDFSPNGSYFVMAATGFLPVSGGVGRDICDAAARFETDVASPTRPTWINYTGGDTLHSVAATGAAVYVGGHQRWLDNPFGRNDARTGAVSRPGIGAIDPATGRALAWNPTKTRGIGTKVIYPTSEGVWFGSDGRRFARMIRDSIAFTPLS